MKRLEAVRVVSTEQVEALREIRNLTASGFSHDTTEISPLAQRAWWVAMRGRVRAWLYFSSGWLIGFGMLRQTEDGRWWNSLAVKPAFRGCGYGAAITADLLAQHDGQVYASVKRDNIPALAMHHLDQWDKIDDPEETLVFFRSKPHD